MLAAETAADEAIDSDGSDVSTATVAAPVIESVETRAMEEQQEWQQYHQQALAVDQQVSELEARLELACSSPATPLAVRELHWLSRKLEELTGTSSTS